MKKVPVPVEVERVHYECRYHVPDCKNHVNNIRVVTKDTKWEMQEVWEYGGTDRSFMDYLGDHAKGQVAGKAPEDTPWRKLNLQFFAEDVSGKAKNPSVGSILSGDVIQGKFKNGLDSIRNLDDLLTNPQKLAGVSGNELHDYLKRNGFDIHPLSDGNYKGIPFEEGGEFKVNWGGDRILQYHPPKLSHHGSEYFKISSGKTGIIRIDLEGNIIRR